MINTQENNERKKYEMIINKSNDEKVINCNLYNKIIKFCNDVINNEVDERMVNFKMESGAQVAFFEAKQSSNVAREMAKMFMLKKDNKSVSEKYINSNIINEYDDYVYMLALLQNIKYVKLPHLAWAMPDNFMEEIKEIKNANVFSEIFKSDVQSEKDSLLYSFLLERLSKIENCYEDISTLKWHDDKTMKMINSIGVEGYIINTANLTTNSFMELSLKMLDNN